MFPIESIVYGWDNGLAYALALLDDLTDEQMVLRPGGNMNHPSWILGHMAIYHPVVVGMLNGEPVHDAADHELFGFRGKGPVDDLSAYGSKAEQVERFKQGHEDVAQSLLTATPEQLAQKPTPPRWAEKYPSIAFMLPDLLLHHEGVHIGQLSIWRRAAGLPRASYPPSTPRPGLLG
ncbi:MAG: DinB family protein [Planctomycetota bacterium]